jgi:ferric-dicitrate binding protein FerR (iron transport regulator)
MTLEERAAYERWVADETHELAMADMHWVWALVEAGRGAIQPRSALTPAPLRPRSARRLMIAAMCTISVGLVALSYVHVSFWTSLDWVTR